MRFGQFPAQLSDKNIILKILDVANPDLLKNYDICRLNEEDDGRKYPHHAKAASASF